MSLQEQFSNERAWRNKRPGIAAGTDAESALFGSPRVTQEEKAGAYVPFARAVEFVKERQPNPLERSKEIKELRSRIAELCLDTRTPVRFYTAVGTPLDLYHGVDAFFEQGGRIATVDVSLREKEIAKADVILLATMDEEGKVSLSKEEIDHAARKVAEILNRANKLAA
jgi:hypothetical protein